MLATFLCAQQADDSKTNSTAENTSSVGVVLAVNNDAITSAQIINPLKERLSELAANLTQPIQSESGRQKFFGQAIIMVRDEVMAQVYQLLLYQYAKVDLEKIDSSKDAIDKALAQRRKEIVAQYDGNEAKAQEELSKKNTSLDEQLDIFKREMIVGSYRQTHFAPSMVITRDQMLRYYRDNLQAKYYQDSSITFRLIDIKKNSQTDIQKANEAMKKLEEKNDFAKVAEEFSDGFQKNQGGLWRPVQLDTNGQAISLREQYQPVISALRNVGVGKHTGIIETDEHFFIAQMVERQEARVIPFAQAQTEIHDALTQQQWKQYSGKIANSLFKKAIINTQQLDQFIKDTTFTAYKQIISK
jgi:hypothetical protein